MDKQELRYMRIAHFMADCLDYVPIDMCEEIWQDYELPFDMDLGEMQEAARKYNGSSAANMENIIMHELDKFLSE